MASTNGNTSTDLIQSVNQSASEYSFFQVIRLLERALENDGVSTSKLRIAPKLSLEPSADEITELTETKEGYEVATSFLGLYGISSSLPNWYTAELIDAREDDQVLAKVLLDIIHQRYYSLYFQTLEKYQLAYQFIETERSNYIKYFFHLLGIGHNFISKFIPDPYLLLRYIALFRQNPHTALGLQTILEDALQVSPIVIEQSVLRTTKIPFFQVFNLGEQANELGVNTVLGNEIEDSSGKIKIRFGPISFTTFQTLVNGSQTCLLMMFLIDAYLNVPLDCDLQFILEEGSVKPIQFGNVETCFLGKNSWIFSGDEPGVLNAELSFFSFKKLYDY